jgi:hypothetical protein
MVLHSVILDTTTKSVLFYKDFCSHQGAPQSIGKEKIVETMPSEAPPLELPQQKRGHKRPNHRGSGITKVSILKCTKEAPKEVKKPSLAVIGAVPFRWLTKQKGTEIFSISLSEIASPLHPNTNLEAELPE